MAKVLVIDDESNIRLMIRLALKFVNHEVHTAADGEEGLRLFGEGATWDIVLLDQRMPGLDGLEVLKQMRERKPEARIILITAFGTIDLAYQAMRQGAVDFLRKPFTAEMLRGAVAEALAAPVSEHPGGRWSRFGFSMTTINGFRLEGTTSGEQDGEVWHAFDVHSPAGETRSCKVILPVYLVRLVTEHAREGVADWQESVWRLLCEEVLANYVWQNSEFPADDVIRVDELTGGLRRWIDAVLAEVN